MNRFKWADKQPDYQRSAILLVGAYRYHTGGSSLPGGKHCPSKQVPYSPTMTLQAWHFIPDLRCCIYQLSNYSGYGSYGAIEPSV